MNGRKLSKADILYYEVSSAWWVGYISNSYLQDLAGRYFAWLVKRKYKRYEHSLLIKQLKEMVIRER